MSGFHPENILPSGPGGLDPEMIADEVAFDRGAIAFNAGFIALGGTLMGMEIIPKFAEALSQLDAPNMIQYGFLGVTIGGLSTLAIASIRSFRSRLSQARYNQRLNAIVDFNGLDS